MNSCGENIFEQGLRRYLREDQIRAVQRVKVGIAGAGGLGSNCAQLLVRSGFVHFVLVDFDSVESSNLNRQFFFGSQVGVPKVQALAENLGCINPAVLIQTINTKITPLNVSALFIDCDIVVEAFDNPECKKMLVEAYINSGKLLVAASGLAGWGESDRIKVRKIREKFYLVGDLVAGIGPGAPPMAPCVAIAAAKQADIVLSYVLGIMGVSINESIRYE